MISGFRREANEICTLLCSYSANSDNSLTDVSGIPIDPIFNGRESSWILDLWRWDR